MRTLQWTQVAPRILVDWVVVQAAFLASLSFVVLKQVQRGGYEMGASIETLRQLFVKGFFPLSFLFPVIFFLLGFYTRSRLYASGYKWRLLVMGTTSASLVYLLVHFLLDRAESLPRAGVLSFLALVNCGVLGSRWLKSLIVEYGRSTASDLTGSAPADRPVLVVGGAGYIGSVLCRRLLGAGCRVRVLDSMIYGDAAIRELLPHPRFELRAGDCRNIQAVVGAVKGVGAIVHLAAIVGDPACEEDRLSAREINYAATRMLVEVAKGYGVERFVFASSCSVYGSSDEIAEERSRVAPLSLYAATKVESERAVLEARDDAFHPVVLRFATVFGYSPRPRFDLVVNLLVAKAYQEGKLTICNKEQWRPLVHVQDVADGILCVLRAPLNVVDGEIFNVGDSAGNCTLQDLAERIRAAFPQAKFEYVENADRRNYRVSFEKMRLRLGFQCAWTIEAGIQQMKEVLQREDALDHASPIYHNQRYLQQLGGIKKEELDARVMAAFAKALQGADRVAVEP